MFHIEVGEEAIHSLGNASSAEIWNWRRDEARRRDSRCENVDSIYVVIQVDSCDLSSVIEHQCDGSHILHVAYSLRVPHVSCFKFYFYVSKFMGRVFSYPAGCNLIFHLYTPVCCDLPHTL